MSFAGKRAVGCVTYLRPGTELVIYEVGDIKQKWSDTTPLIIDHISWDPEGHRRMYVVSDSRQTRRVVSENDLAEAPND